MTTAALGVDTHDDGREEKLLNHVLTTAEAGNASSVISAIDSFCWAGNWMMNVGDCKGEIVTSALKKYKPALVVELGGYCGYSAVLIASTIREWGGVFFSLEFNDKFAAIARQIIDHAGLSKVAQVLVGPAAESLQSLKAKLAIEHVDFFFFDHWKEFYLADIKIVEHAGLLRKGSVIVADNVIYPGAPDYLEYVRSRPYFSTVFVEAKLEYNESIVDGVEITEYVG